MLPVRISFATPPKISSTGYARRIVSRRRVTEQDGEFAIEYSDLENPREMIDVTPAKPSKTHLLWQRWRDSKTLRPVLGVIFLSLCVAWAYWPTLQSMVHRWTYDPQYSHGFLVPIFAAFVLWSRRNQRPATWQPEWWGVGLLAVAVVCRFLSAYFYHPWLDGYSLLPMFAGGIVLTGGRKTLLWCWPAVLFLGFMIPLPFRIEMTFAFPLRRVATLASTFALQTFGYPALAEGNIIRIGTIQLEVINACSGLGMLFTFFALATAVAFIVERPLLDKIIVVLSAVPIAILVNVIRITMTGVAYVSFGLALGKLILHDLAGWLMMPIALGFVWLELWYLSKLLLPVGEAAPLGMTFGESGSHILAPGQVPEPKQQVPVGN